ncbi:MAG TPA: hypothetical protein VER33_25025 [Polyangiaceae bacterium]|nr:hypothetical protein [Polyangiaceae bacterium]
MSNRIDCSFQSHASCLEPEAPPGNPAQAAEATAPAEVDEASQYDCVNDCIASLGVAQLVAGVVTGLGCYAALPACPALIGGAAGALVGWCDADCSEPGVQGNR